MVVPINKDQTRAIQTNYFPETLFFRYPCAFAKSKAFCDITIEVKQVPKDTGKINFILQETIRYI